jgi:hypothetical protein
MVKVRAKGLRYQENPNVLKTLDILNEIANLATDPSMQHIWWFYGLAGFGKSTNSTTIADTLGH